MCIEGVWQTLAVLFLVTVLAKPLFPLVGCNLVTLTFTTARHKKSSSLKSGCEPVKIPNRFVPCNVSPSARFLAFLEDPIEDQGFSAPRIDACPVGISVAVRVAPGVLFQPFSLPFGLQPHASRLWEAPFGPRPRRRYAPRSHGPEPARICAPFRCDWLFAAGSLYLPLSIRALSTA